MTEGGEDREEGVVRELWSDGRGVGKKQLRSREKEMKKEAEKGQEGWVA